MSSPALQAKMAKRLQREIENSKKCTNPYIWYAPVSEDNLEWHFTIRGPDKSPFEGGLYHGKIVLPPNFPFSAPDFYFLTENGRYTINQKICLSISGYHNESWQPAITIETMVQMIQVFMEDYTDARRGISFIETSEETRRALAKKSVDYCCPKCGKVANLMR
ncbi:hypothetical protein WA577_001236, partial [Blastocystis sp. JDR]